MYNSTCWYPYPQTNASVILTDYNVADVDCMLKLYQDIPWDGRLLISFKGNKQEGKDIITKAGFASQKWYYPIPNHHSPVEIYTDEYLPNVYMNHRYIPDNMDAHLYNIIKNETFVLQLGSYFVELIKSINTPHCPVEYAAITNYRKPQHQFITTILNNGTVQKTNLQPEGYKNLQNLKINHDVLASVDVNVLPLAWVGKQLVMPRIIHPTLLEYWVKMKTNITFNEDEIIRPFDAVVLNINKTIPTGKCYWEMVPANCFYDVEKSECIFFDQEYCWDNIDIEYAIARAISVVIYDPIFVNNKNKWQLLEKLKARYGLIKEWSVYSQFINKTTNAIFKNP